MDSKQLFLAAAMVSLVSAGTLSTVAQAKGKAAKGSCSVTETNECGGKGACGGEAAGKAHDCKGKNECKGNVIAKKDVTKKECDKLKGTFTPNA